ncbi:MAG TPA: DUF4386 family protein [Gemmatimonadaceae bacterium]
MDSPKNAGRTIALAMLVQVVLSPPVYFRWMRPATSSDFLANAAASADTVRFGMLLTFVLGAMTIVASLAAFPIIRRHSERLALAYVGLAFAGFATLMADTVGLRNLLALSMEFAKPGAPSDLLQTLATVGRANWISAHYTNLTISHGTVFLFFVILFRFALVPKVLAALGLAASALSTTTVASMLVGYPIPFSRGIMPMAVVTLVLIAWLLFRGLADRTTSRKTSEDIAFARA